MEDMANRIIATRSGEHIGPRWAGNFVQRPELRTRFQRKYDYKRAKCEDPEVIRGWFKLVYNTISKYRICEEDIYNFDETGFIMDMKVTTRTSLRNTAKNTISLLFVCPLIHLTFSSLSMSVVLGH